MSGIFEAVKIGFDLWSGYQQAEMVIAGGKLNKQVSNFNARFAELDAFNAEKDGYSQAARYASVVERTKAAQEAAFAANNVDSGFGTAAQIKAETDLVGFLNTQDIMNQAHARAMGFKREARNIRLQGAMGQIASQTQAQAIQNAALIEAGGYALRSWGSGSSTSALTSTSSGRASPSEISGPSQRLSNGL